MFHNILVKCLGHFTSNIEKLTSLTLILVSLHLWSADGIYLALEQILQEFFSTEFHFIINHQFPLKEKKKTMNRKQNQSLHSIQRMQLNQTVD